MAKKTYESYMEELKNIISDFENGNLTLDESLKKYEESLKILKKMEEILNEAEGKLIEIQEKK